MGEETWDIVVPKTSGYKTVDDNHSKNDLPAALSGIKNKTIREIVISSAVMLCVAISWSLSTQFAKSALNFKQSFYAPYFLMWFGTNFMITGYPVYLLYALIKNRFDLSKVHALHEEASLIYSQTMSKFKSYFLLTGFFLLLWTGSNYCYSQSLGHISASAASSIMSSNTVIICILGWLILHDKFIPFRLVAIAAAVGGVVVMSLDDEFAGSILGISLSLASAFLAALYKLLGQQQLMKTMVEFWVLKDTLPTVDWNTRKLVLFKKIIGNATLGQVSLFMSGIGLMNIVINAIPVFTLIGTGKENVIWSEVPWLTLVASAILTLLFNFLLNFGVALLHPLVVSIGMLLGIPISAGVDIVVRHMDATPYFIVGGILILISCMLIILPLHKLKIFHHKTVEKTVDPEKF